MKAYRTGFIALIQVLAATALTAASARAGTILVNSTIQVVNPGPGGNGDGMCQLSEAILAANTDMVVDGCVAGSGTDTIILPAGTFTLTQVDHFEGGFLNRPVGLPAITTIITIQGAGATMTIIERSSAPATPDFCIFLNRNDLTLRDLTVRGGRCSNGGGVRGGARVHDSIFENNQATAGDGGAIEGGAFVRNSIFRNNTAGSHGGAIASGCCIDVQNTLFENNSAAVGGAINCRFTCPFSSVQDSTFRNNTATQQAGALAAGTFTVARSLFIGNSAATGGAVEASGATVTECLFLNNMSTANNVNGGAMLIGSSSDLIDRSTFIGNSSGLRGGAVAGGGNARILNSTFHDNTAVLDGGAIQSTNFLHMQNLTVTQNQSMFARAGGINFGDFDTVKNVIVAENLAPNDPAFADCVQRGQTMSQGHNLLGIICGNGFPSTTGDISGTQANPLDPLLRIPLDNGGPMVGSNVGGVAPMPLLTRALLQGSPALEAGDPGAPGSGGTTCEATDQRGVARPQPLGGRCDIGAFEDATGMGAAASADIAITKTDSPDPVNAGSPLTYTITVTNNGPDGAANVMVSDMLPPGVTFGSVTPPCMHAAGTVTCNYATLSSMASQMITLVVTPNAAGMLSNTASVTSSTPDPDNSNNSATESTTVMASTIDLSVTKSDSPDPVNAGGNITYTITVENLGPGNATNVSVTDPTPATTTFVSATGAPGWTISAPAVGGTGNVVFSIASLAPSMPATFTITVRTSAGSVPMVSNTVTAAASEPDSNLSNNSATEPTTVNPVADLTATKADAPDPVIAGTNLTYTITVNNLGPSDAANAVLSDPLPANTTFQSITTPAGWTCMTPAVGAGGTVTCNNPNFAVGGMSTFTIVVRVAASVAQGAVLNNTATVSSSTADPDSSNNAGAQATTVNRQADLATTKTDAPDPVNANTNLTYTVVVTNNGPSDAANAMLSDPLPANTTFQSVTTPAGWTCMTPAVGAGGTITCTNPSLAASSSSTFTFVVRPSLAAAGTTISNTATASSATADPTAGNNAATATTMVTLPPATNFTIVASPSVINLTPGQTANSTISLAGMGGAFNSAITLSCRVDPPLEGCTLTPPSGTPGSGTFNSTLAVMSRGQGSVPSGAPAGPGLLLLLSAVAGWAVARRTTQTRRRLAQATAVALLLASLGMLQGCTQFARTVTGPYTVTVTGTSGSISNSTTVTVNLR